MTRNVVPMIHVPDVRATVAWYTAIGFTVMTTYGDGEEMNFAMLSFGSGEVMFNAAASSSSATSTGSG